MKRSRLVFFLTLAVSLMATTVFGAGSAILLDEDFEDGVAFEELNWPLMDNARVPIIPGDIDLYQGYEVRAFDQASTGPMNPPQVLSKGFATVDFADAGPHNGVMVTTERFFTGASSLRMMTNATTKTIRLQNPGNFPLSIPNAWSVLQMALSVNKSSPSEPWASPGTTFASIYFKEGIDDNQAVDPPTVNINHKVELTVNSSTTIDIVSVAPIGGAKTKIGSLEGGPGDWAMLTYLPSYLITTPGRGVTTQVWRCFDLGNNTSGRDIYIGPQPANPLSKSENTFLFTVNMPTVPTGMGIYCNSDAPGVFYNPTDIHAEWGNLNDAGNNHINRTILKGWEIQIHTPDMPLFIDDLYWDSEGHDDHTPGANGITLAAAARMQPFTGIIDPAWDTTEARDLSVDDTWVLYE
jgi:hypothetical protein